MVGCWFTGQGKKGDCVGKKVNGGPVVGRVNYVHTCKFHDLHSLSIGAVSNKLQSFLLELLHVLWIDLIPVPVSFLYTLILAIELSWVGDCMNML